LVGGLAALYAVSPVDLIADSRPAGYLDDLVVVALAVPLMLRLVPEALRTHHRAHAALLLSRRTWAVGGARARLAGVAADPPHSWSEPLARAWARIRGAPGGPGYVVDAELRFVSVNAAALGAWGKGPDEVLGRRILEVFPGATPEGYRAHLEALRTARAQRVRTHSRLFDRPMRVDIRPLSDGLRVQFALAA
jgi:PAS domain-containing protein